MGSVDKIGMLASIREVKCDENGEDGVHRVPGGFLCGFGVCWTEAG